MGTGTNGNLVRRVVFWSALFLAVVMSARAILEHRYRGLYEAKVTAAEEAGRLLMPESLAHASLAPGENALPALREAAAPLVVRHEKEPKTDPSYVLLAYTPEIWRTSGFALSEEEDQVVSFGIASAGEALRALRDAENIPGFTLGQWWDEGADDLQRGRDLTALALLNRYAAARAWWEGSRGNVDGAFGWVDSAFALAARLEEEPMVLSAVLRVNMGQNALTILKALMDRHALPEVWRERLGERVVALRDREAYGRAFAAEAGINTRVVMERIEADRRFWAYLTRPLARRFLCGTLDSFDGVIQGIEEQDTGARVARYQALAENVGSSRTLPTLLRSVRSFEDSVARCDMLLMSMALKRYKADHGAYPESLEGLAPDYVAALPDDVYAAEPYGYAADGEGFMLFSGGMAWLRKAAPEEDFSIVCRFDS